MGDAVWEQSICFLSASEVQDLLKNRFVRSLDSAQQGEIQRMWGAFIVQPRRWKLISTEPSACTAFIYQRAALIPNQRPFVLGPSPLMVLRLLMMLNKLQLSPLSLISGRETKRGISVLSIWFTLGISFSQTEWRTLYPPNLNALI